MPTQSASIVGVLLAGVVGRLVTHYVLGQLLGTLMRHVPPAGAVVARSVGVVEAAEASLLVAAAGLALLAAAGDRGALARAVPMAAVAAAAEEEDLPAVGAVADDEAQRVHGLGRRRQELDAPRAPCDEPLVEPTATGAT
jgi:hypothetical protein